MPSTETVYLFGDGAIPEDYSTSTTFSTTTISSPTPLANIDEPSLGLLVARQGGPLSSDGDSEETGGHSMSIYYFVFFAILVCIAILCVYFVWKRRKNALMIRPNARGEGYHRDVREWDTVRYRHRYWNTNHRNEQTSREEGLNENGEAPPPYMPKEDEEMGNTGSQTNGQCAHGEDRQVHGEPSIPMQTLSRNQAGLKPPGYEQSVQPVGNEPSSSRLP
jgi:hypothetical protein